MLPIFLSFLAHAAARNVSILPNDPMLSFAGGWAAFQDSNANVFLATNKHGHALHVELPNNTAELLYLGMKRSSMIGSLYSLCIDSCGVKDVYQPMVIDGRDPSFSDDAEAMPAILFTLTLDPSTPHILTVSNVPDTRFNRQTELTFSSLLLSILDEAHGWEGIPVVSGSINVAESETDIPTSLSSVLGARSVAQTSESPTDVASGDLGLNGTVIALISIFPALGLISLLVGLLFFYRQHRRRRPPRPPRPPRDVLAMEPVQTPRRVAASDLPLLRDDGTEGVPRSRPLPF